MTDLASDDVDATAAAITGNGGALLRGPVDTPFGFGRMALLTDPDGASFAVVGSAGTG
jgi:predicted enzyme related to lactoylglutathione lyase